MLAFGSIVLARGEVDYGSILGVDLEMSLRVVINDRIDRMADFSLVPKYAGYFFEKAGETM